MVQFFTENQFSLLKAIAKDGIVAQLTSGKFIKEHKLNGASSVKAALKVIEDKELVYRTNKGYIIYDRFMGLSDNPYAWDVQSVVTMDDLFVLW